MEPDRAFIIHGYLGYPGEAWQPWLKTELERRGYRAELPAMPHADRPEVEEWVAFIANLIGAPDPRTVLIAHSLGATAALHYLETLGSAGKSIGKTVLVATNFAVGLTPQEADDRTGGDPVLRNWLTRPVDERKVKASMGRCAVILSDDDPYIPVEEARAAFTERLGAEIIIERGLGHMNEDSHITQLPSALAAAIS
jgi:predicted alpha/beta hydrolase family esterase